jgi:hypothetical protein
VPAWHRKTQEWVRQGKLVVVGIAQEQHPDRCRLFAQWQQLDWPIVYDPINVMEVRGVPVEVAVDEHGIVRSVRPGLETLEAEFLDKTFPSEGAAAARKVGEAHHPNLAALRRTAEQTGSPEAWRELGDALSLWGGIAEVDHAIDAYERVLRMEPDDSDAHFRVGVCYRMRWESERRVPGDFQTAVDCWDKARAMQPNQYIWRRRIEQYGPRNVKPYPFYDWIETAAREIRARGEEEPVELKVLPTGGELAQPAQRFIGDQHDVKPPDPQGRINRDAQRLVSTEVTLVPPRVKPGEVARVYVTLRPDARRKVHWNNEAEPLQLWIDIPKGWQVERRLLVAPQGEKPETSEPRHFEFELLAASDGRGVAEVAAYALYYVCEDVGGTCLFLRQDIPIQVKIDE